MNESRLKGLMGLCVRAGQAVFGGEFCLKSVREQKAALLLLDGDIAKASREKYEQACVKNDVRYGLLPAGLIEESTGKPGKAMAILAGGLAEQIIHCLESSGQNNEK